MRIGQIVKSAARMAMLLLLAAALALPTFPLPFGDAPLHAQQTALAKAVTGQIRDAYGTRTDAAENLISDLSNLAEQVGQFAEQGGKLTGRTAPKVASITGQLLQILVNFDGLTCDVNVMALGIKQRELIVEATRPGEYDPELDRAVQQINELIAKLQELCNRHVHDLYDDTAAGADDTALAVPGGGETAEAGETPNVEERICRQRCGDLYHAFMRAEEAYLKADKKAKEVRAKVGSLPQDAARAEEAAAKAEQDAKDTRARREQLARDITNAPTPAHRDQAAAEYARTNPEEADAFAQEKRAAAAAARQKADEAEQDAREAEADASVKYSTMKILYEAWLACARNCADQAKRYSKVDVDIWSLFGAPPRSLRAPPPYYRHPAGPTQQAVTPDRRTSRLVLPPAALAGGVLSGVVLDADEKPRENTQVALEMPGGNIAEVNTDSSGGFIAEIPAAGGQVGLVLFDGTAPGVALEVLDGVPSGFPATPESYIQSGGALVLGEPYRAVSIGQPGGVPEEVPVGTAIGADGESGMTSLTVPAWVQPGPVEIGLLGVDGEQVMIESQAYSFVEAWLERDKLMSGETAQFGYQLDFGDGPGQVMMTIAVTGAVTYAKAGQPQILQLDEEGRVTFTDTINALEGTPAGAPFAIIPTFAAVQ